MASLKEFSLAVAGLRTIYSSDKFMADKTTFKLWYHFLGDLDYKVLSAAADRYIAENKFPPKPADIRQLANEMVTKEIYDWSAGWEQVLKAIRYHGYYDEPGALASMDEITAETTRRLGFKQICLSENINQDRANFRMIYEELAERRARDNALPAYIKEQIGAVQRMAIGEKDEQ